MNQISIWYEPGSFSGLPEAGLRMGSPTFPFFRAMVALFVASLRALSVGFSQRVFSCLTPCNMFMDAITPSMVYVLVCVAMGLLIKLKCEFALLPWLATLGPLLSLDMCLYRVADIRETIFHVLNGLFNPPYPRNRSITQINGVPIDKFESTTGVANRVLSQRIR